MEASKIHSTISFTADSTRDLCNTLLNASTTYQNSSPSLHLFSSSTLSLEASIAILKQVHKYILDTQFLPNQALCYFKGIYTTCFQPSDRSVVPALIPLPYHCPNPSNISSLYDGVIIFFYYCIYSLCFR